MRRRSWLDRFTPVVAATGLSWAVLSAAGCPPPPEPPDAGPATTGPEVSTQQHEDLAAAKARIVPYDVERGTTVYAIRDLLQVAERVTNPRERGEAQFLAAAATLDLVLYSDLAADDRPLGGLRDAWQADGRNGIVSAVDAFLARMAGSFLPRAEENARVVAAALEMREHTLPDAAALNGIAASDGPLSFAARVVLLDVHSRLLDRALVEGPGVLQAEGAALAAGLPDPPGEAFASLDAASQATARLLAFASANAAAVRGSAAQEPLAALLGSWLDARHLDERTLSFVRPLGAADLPGGGDGLPVAPFTGRLPGARLYVHVAAQQVAIGLADEVRLVGGAVELAHAAVGGGEDGPATCAVTDPLPASPRRWSCVQTALAAAAAGGGTRVLLAADGNAALTVVATVMREARLGGLTQIEVGGVDGTGTMTSFPISLPDEEPLVATSAAVRIAQGGFYVGKRGELMQVPRASGSYDYAGLQSTVRGREGPFVLTPADGTSWAVVFATISALAEPAAASGAVVQLIVSGT